MAAWEAPASSFSAADSAASATDSSRSRQTTSALAACGIWPPEKKEVVSHDRPAAVGRALHLCLCGFRQAPVHAGPSLGKPNVAPPFHTPARSCRRQPPVPPLSARLDGVVGGVDLRPGRLHGRQRRLPRRPKLHQPLLRGGGPGRGFGMEGSTPSPRFAGTGFGRGCGHDALAIGLHAFPRLGHLCGPQTAGAARSLSLPSLPSNPPPPPRSRHPSYLRLGDRSLRLGLARRRISCQHRHQAPSRRQHHLVGASEVGAVALRRVHGHDGVPAHEPGVAHARHRLLPAPLQHRLRGAGHVQQRVAQHAALPAAWQRQHRLQAGHAARQPLTLGDAVGRQVEPLHHHRRAPQPVPVHQCLSEEGRGVRSCLGFFLGGGGLSACQVPRHTAPHPRPRGSPRDEASRPPAPSAAARRRGSAR